jgi:hypothetical protein
MNIANLQSLYWHGMQVSAFPSCPDEVKELMACLISGHAGLSSWPHGNVAPQSSRCFLLSRPVHSPDDSTLVVAQDRRSERVLQGGLGLRLGQEAVVELGEHGH